MPTAAEQFGSDAKIQVVRDLYVALNRQDLAAIKLRDDIGCVLTAVVGSEEVTVTTTPGQTVLAALLYNGVPAPYSCMGGACGTCRARITYGRADMDQNQALESHEAAAGYVLTCQARPRTARLDVDFNS
jgi:ferredoxin